MDQKKIRAFAGTVLLAGVIAFMGTGAVQAQSVTPSEAAHHVIEQELQSHVPGQAVYAQNGVVIRSGIIREKDLLIHYPQVRVMGKPEVSRRITRYFEKQAEISRENYNKANTMEEKLTSRVDFAVMENGISPSRPTAMILWKGQPIPPVGNWGRPLIWKPESWFPGRRS